MCLFFICFAKASFGQETGGKILGQVVENGNRSPIAAANVLVAGTTRGCASDLDGNFELDGLEPGIYTLRVSVMGYETRSVSEIHVHPGRSTTVEVFLTPTMLEGEEVTVTAGYFRGSVTELPTSSRTLRYEEVRRAPGAVEDVQRMIQALPGVAGENDQNNEIVVRGGSPYENLIVMDGIEIDNINHYGYQGGTGGPISLVNPEFLQEITFASGGFSARYGDRLSSVLAIDLREGDREYYQGMLEFSMAGAGGNFEGPIDGGRGSFLVSARKSYLDLLKDAVGLTAIPEYWDTQAKITYDLSNRHTLSINALYGNDRIFIEEDEESGYSRGAESVDYFGDRMVFGGRLRSIWGNGYSDLIVAGVRNTYEIDVFQIDYGANDEQIKRQIYENRSIESNLQFSLNYNGRGWNHDQWSVGASVKPIRFDYDNWFEADTTVYDDGYLAPPDSHPDVLITPQWSVDETSTSNKYAAYAQYSWRPHSRITFTGGVRYDGYEYSDEHTVGPRTSLTWDLLPRTTLNLAYGIYYQAHPQIVYTNDPAGGNRYLDHSKSSQYVAGLNFLLRESTLLSVEGYYKDYDKLPVNEQAYVRELTDDYSFRSYRYLTIRDKDAWGMELFLQQTMADCWYGTLSYSYGVCRSNDDAWGTFDSDYDFRHVLTAVLGYSTNFSERSWYRNFKRHWYGSWIGLLPFDGDEVMFSSRFRYIDGRPYSQRAWYAEGADSPDPVYESHWATDEINNRRYPEYLRWDVRIDEKYYFGNSALVVFMEVQNVLDRMNVADYIYADDGEIDTVSQFRFFFVGGIRYEF